MSSLDGPHSAGITDPIGYVMAYVPVALALVAMVIAFLPAAVRILELLTRRSRTKPAREIEAHPSTA